MAEKYYSILTNRGKELEAQSSATGKPVIIKDFVVGDGNGQPVKPEPAQTKLVREVYRNAISALQVSPDQANQFIAQLVLAAGVGGFVVREVGLLTDAGELYSVANCAAIEKPENGVSVNLQYRLAVSETANIELKVATGDGLFLRQDANLSDVKDASLSRKSLGLKGAAVLDVGKVAKTVAAGDDTRIVNALQKNNNLSDLPDKVLARDNLQLKTAALKDIVTSATDTTVDRVPVVGWQGLGSAIQIRMGQVSQFLAYAAADLKEVPSNGAGWQSAYGASRRAQIFMDTAGKVYSRFSISDVALDTSTPWAVHYTTLNKPSAGDVGAVAKTGDTMSGRLIMNVDGDGIWLQPKTAGYASYIISKDSANANHWYVGAGSTTNTNVTFLNYKGANNSISLNSDGTVNLNPTQGKSAIVNGPLQLGSAGSAILNIGDNDSGLRNSVDGQIDLWSNSAMVGYWNKTTFSYTGQIIPTNYANFDSRYYTKSQSDAGYMPKTGAYTKAESDGRFQPKGSYGAPDTSGISGNVLWWKNTATGVITMMGQTAGVANSGRVTFPFAFPTKCFGVIPTRNNSSGQGAAMQPYDVNTTGWNLRIAGGGTETVMWVAMGK
ncbi:phage tail protein [Enterobacter genomosp. O]|uniref:phage tail-collar fiber domain-containing protein n=1 Tax=Enterobacter genomosp. O TaxID=2364150 RepID=UPI00069AE92A|nr:phage tail protein [Enterobacter genomosp. O]